MEGLIYLSGEDHTLALGELKGAMRAMELGHGILSSSGPLVILDDVPPIGLAGRMGHCRFSGSVELTAEADPGSIIMGLDLLLVGVSKEEPITLIVKGVDPENREERKALSTVLDGHLRELGLKVKYRGGGRRLVVCLDEIAYIGWVVEETDRRASRERRIRNLPFERPVVMAPSLSRAMVNLSGLPAGSRALDPFVGPGGLMIEAGLVGLECTGVEIDEEIAAGAQRNVEHMGLSERTDVHVGDSRYLPSLEWFLERAPFDGIITDPPFGRSARIEGGSADGLLVEVISAALPYLKDGAPVVLDVVDVAVLERLEGLEVTESYPVYVHRSMTRYLTLLRKV
ncbi:MAG: RsmD family RNA methyltransferase [Thermoplasmata archaeon]|nr:RsmD family RNA methyltransferase [Thermoplasmata archaeon]